MITQWDIISRMDPKTKIVRYTLVTDGTEADARIILKKLKGQVSALKKALRPFIYAFRLHNDLDENTLENIRTAVRDVIEQTDKLSKSAAGRASNDLFGDDSTIRIAPEKPTEQSKVPFSERKTIELDLEDATIISSKRIVGKEENPQPPTAQSVSAQRYEENIKNPHLPVIDMMTPAPQDAQDGNNMSMPVLPEDTFVARGKNGNKQDLVALDAMQQDLPDIDPSKDKKSSKLSGWFHHKKQAQEPAQKEEKTVQRPPVKARPEPKPEPVLKPIGEPPAQTPFEMDAIPRLDTPGAVENDPLLTPLQARGKDAPQPQAQEPVTQPALQAQAEKPAQAEQPAQTAEQPTPSEEKPAPTRQTFSLKKGSKAPLPKPAKAAEPEDDFPQINVQVRPAVFDEEENKAQSVAQAQPNKTAQDLPAPSKADEKPAPVQAEQAQVKAEPAPQVEAAPAQAEEKQPQAQAAAEPKEQAEPAPQEQAAANQAQEARAQDEQAQPAPAAENQAQAAAPRKDEKDIAEEEQISLHPLNISLEDMFLAETKYDMFVDIDETITQRAKEDHAAAPQKAEPKPQAQTPQAAKPAPKAQTPQADKAEPKAQTAPKAQPKAEKPAQEPAAQKPAQKPVKKAAPKPAPAKKAPLPPPPPVMKDQPPQPCRLIKRRTPKDTL